MFAFTGGGYGGHEGGDGLTNGSSPISIAKTTPVEVAEGYNPVLFERYALREDSAGPGRHRGGFGVEVAVRLRGAEATSTVLADRGKFGPPGAAGGEDASRSEVVWELGGKEFRPPHVSKASSITMKRGDLLVVRSPGGGGYGSPAERDREAVMRDVHEGYMDAERAAEAYGVEVGSDHPTAEATA